MSNVTFLPEVGRRPVVVRNAEVIPLTFTFKITFVGMKDISVWLDPPLQSVVWKEARTIGEAVGKCFLDGDVPMGWEVKNWVRTQ